MAQDASSATKTEARATLVTGAAGFLGRAVVQSLVHAGVPTVALVRRPEQQRGLEALGARTFVGDVLDVLALDAAAGGCKDFVHLASAEGVEGAPPDFAHQVRVQGVRNLLGAASRQRGHRLLLGSGYWVYAGSPRPIEEDSPVEPAGESRNNFDAERATFEGGQSSGVEVCVVRPGMVYGNGAWFRPLAQSVRDGTYRLIEGGTNGWSFVSLPDTAAAFTTVLSRGLPGEVYNIADGAPAPWGEFARWVARQLGAPEPPSLTREEAEEAYGPIIARHLAADRRMTGTKLRGLGWRPRHPTFREGLPPVLEEIGRL